MSAWPSSNDYTAAIQSPQFCFRDLDLKNASVEKNRLTRMPKVWTGNFAQVYELRTPTKRWAVKCFTRSSADLTVRYSEVSKAIASSTLPYFVDFRFIPDEMLVNGKRYPIVKMQWVEGQSLDKYVEANLFQPQALLDTAASLLKMVRDLEERQLAHGDLQHGNVVITPAGLKLVDYDGMFVPAFAGKTAPEIGLPSYQHPRRGAGDYGIGLDRFALLVMCTGLCAVAVDPSVWYEFYTGDNLLFSASDFKDPHTSTLFRRLSSLGDGELRTLADTLKAACGQAPLGVSLPGGALSFRASGRHAPWWVTSPVPASASSKVEPTASAQPIARSVDAFRHVGAAVLTSIGALALVLGGVAGPEAGVVAALLGGLAYLLERARRYNSLPALVRRRELQSKLAEFRTELQKQAAAKTRLEQQANALTQQENQEKSEELKRLMDAHASAQLSAIPISRLLDVSGIGPYVVGNFKNAGIHNAAQLKQRGPYVQGVGTKRRAQILGMLSQWERDASRGRPNALPPDIDLRITGKYQQQRQVLVNQIGAISRRIATVSSDTTRAESELKQLHVPTFRQFLKNTV